MKRTFIAALTLIGSFSYGLAHDVWLDNTLVDPQTKQLCCSESDCKLIPETVAHATSGGYYLDDTGETIPWPRVQPSPDGGFWACRLGGITRCFFAPTPGA